jgi:predicted permease
MDTATAFAFILAMLVLGKTMRWRGVVPDAAPDALNQVVLWVCLPASILLHGPQLSLDPSVLVLVLVPWVLSALAAALVWAVARALRWPEATTGVLLLAVPLGNTSFLGYPLIAALLGPDALPYAVVYDQFGSFLLLSTYGVVVLAWTAHGEPPPPAAIARRVLTFPPFVALVLALAVMPARYPAPVEYALQLLADALLPLAALAVGMQLTLRLPREHLAPLAFGLLGKLLLLPLAAWWLAGLMEAGGSIRSVAVLQAAMPTMITAMALASSARLAPGLAAALAGYGVLVAALTLPLWRWLLG